VSSEAVAGGPSAALIAAGVAAAAAVLLGAPLDRSASLIAVSVRTVDPSLHRGWLVRYRLPLCVLVGAGAASLVADPLAPLALVGVGIGLWVVIGRLEAPGVRAEREAARRDLVPIIELLAAALAAGAPPGRALDVACLALPGAGADRLRVVRAQLRLGADPESSWAAAADDEILAPLARTMARAQHSGAPIAGAIARLASDLAEQDRAGVEERARAVGVKAAIPLGVCLLPSFLLLGIVPVAVGLLSGIA
jgi:Flp pilus assembly protein TadB